MATTKTTERAEALAELRELCPPGTTVYTVLRHTSRSGMTRVIDPMVMEDGSPRRIAHLIAQLGDWKFARDYDGLRVEGCGMDMGFALVYDLGRTLYPDGFDTWDGYWRNEPMDHDPDGGYALNQRWL